MKRKLKSLFTRPNKIVNGLLALILLLGPLAPAASAAKAPAVSGNSYYLTYTTASSGKLYAYKDSSLKTKTGGWIACSTDECRIIAVSGSAVKVSYPAGSSRKEAWFPRSSFTSFDLANGSCSQVTSSAKITTYRWSSGSKTAGYIAKGDTVRILCVSGSRTQVIYPVGKNYRMAWVNTSDVTKYLKSTTTSSTTASSSSAANVANGKYVLASGLNGNMVADIDGNKTANGTNCHLYTYNGTSAQIFQITHVSNGWYKIAHTGSGKVLDVSGGIKAPCINVQIYQYNGTNAQLWKFIPTSGGYYIQNKLGYYLDVSGGTAKDSTNIWVYSGNGTKAQVWSLRSVSSGSSSSSSSSSDTWKEPMKNYFVCGNDWSEYYAPKAAKGRPDHVGVDIASKSGSTEVVAAADGTVEDFGNNADNGKYVLLKHTLNGKTVYSFYAHLQSYASLTRGATVKQGDYLGKMGTTGSSSTGDHLHFAIFTCTGTPKKGGGFVGYAQSFTGNKVTYGNYTFYSPKYVLDKNALPG